MKQVWEYKILVVDFLYDENLNAQGKDGWELVAMRYGLAPRPDEKPKAPPAEHEHFHLIFKRPRT